MVKVALPKRNAKAYEDYFCAQAGHGLPVFVGGRGQSGRGLGSILSGIGRAIIPMVKSAGKSLLRETAHTGLRIASDVLAGQNVKSAVQSRAKEAGQRLVSGALSTLTGNGNINSAPRRPRPQSHSHSRRGYKHLVGKRKRKAVSSDIFD
jgi:type IV secretory pathway TrbL component